MRAQISQSNEFSKKKHDKLCIIQAWRKIILNWTFGLCERFNCDRRTFAQAVSLFDRFLAKQELPKNYLQLLAVPFLHLLCTFQKESACGGPWACSSCVLLLQGSLSSKAENITRNCSNTAENDPVPPFK